MEILDQVQSYENIYSSAAREDGLKLIQLLAPQKGKKVLHLGCATGYLSKVLSDFVGPEGLVVGVDPDSQRLKFAREKYHATNLLYLEGKAEAIPGDHKDFDVVFSTYMLHWCEDIDAVLKGSAAIMRPGGKFGFVAFTDQLNTHLQPENMFSKEFREAFTSSIHPINLNKLKEAATVNQYKIEFINCHIQDNKFKDVSDLVGYYMTHFNGRFDSSHFNSEAMTNFYGEGEFSIKVEVITAVLEKL